MRKHTLITLTFLFSFLSISFSNNSIDQTIFISKYSELAIQEMARTGIPASVTLAQAILESDWGRGTLAQNSNNYFGIKCKGNWKGESYYHKDDDYKNGKLIKSCFRAYDSVNDSYIDHSEFLMNNPRYSKLFKLEKTDYKGWSNGLKECGYATSPTYAKALISLIERHELFKYDVYTGADLIAAAAPVYSIPGHQAVSNPTDHFPAIEQPIDPATVPPVYVIPDDYGRNHQKINQVFQNTAQKTERENTIQPSVAKDKYSQNTAPVSIVEASTFSKDETALLVSAVGGDTGQLLLSRAPRVNNNLRR